MPFDAPFSSMFSTPAMREAVSGAAWVSAMLEVEAALARAEATLGLIPQSAADEITDVRGRFEPDMDALSAATLAAANPAGPVVAALEVALSPEAAGHLHLGATSQDIVDTAMMLIARRGVGLILDDVAAAADACARLADEHRGTVMAGRTLLQQAVPIPFGMKAATWLSGLDDATVRLRALPYPVQFGGAAGTLSALGDDGIAVLTALATELEMDESRLPWHTNRIPLVDIASALGVTAGALGKIAGDVILLAQTEVAEVRTGGGRSSAMPHKQNPSEAVTVQACVRRAHALMPLFYGAMIQEHERAAGAWQAEWTALADLLELVSAAASHCREVLSTLEVDQERMRANLDAGGPGMLMAESVMMALAHHAGRAAARKIVDAAVARARAEGRPLVGVLKGADDIAAILSADDIDAAMDPAQYLGSSSAFIDRALEHHRSLTDGRP